MRKKVGGRCLESGSADPCYYPNTDRTSTAHGVQTQFLRRETSYESLDAPHAPRYDPMYDVAWPHGLFDYSAEAVGGRRGRTAGS